MKILCRPSRCEQCQIWISIHASRRIKKRENYGEFPDSSYRTDSTRLFKQIRTESPLHSTFFHPFDSNRNLENSGCQCTLYCYWGVNNFQFPSCLHSFLFCFSSFVFHSSRPLSISFYFFVFLSLPVFLHFSIFLFLPFYFSESTCCHRESPMLACVYVAWLNFDSHAKCFLPCH
jgi:hypothetical protein